MKKLLIIFTSIISLLGIGVMPVAVLAADTGQKDACEGLRTIDPSMDCNVADTWVQGRVGGVVRSIITILTVLVGMVCVIMIIIGGFRYVVSGGDSNSTKGAKDTILYALIGLVVVVFSQVIVRFVLSRL